MFASEIPLISPQNPHPLLAFPQYLIAGLLWLPTLSGGLNIMSYTFAGFSPPHRCYLPCQDTSTTSNTVELSNLTWYTSLHSLHSLQQDELQSGCQFYDYLGEAEDTVADGCQADMFNTSHLTHCQSFVYDRSVFQETLVTKFDLVCSDSWKKGFIGKQKYLYKSNMYQTFYQCFEKLTLIYDNEN